VGPPGELIEHVPGLHGVGRLAEDDAVDVDLGVAGQDGPALDRTRLAEGVLEDDLARVALRQLLDVRRADVELDPELLEDRAPLRRGAREGQASGKNSAASRAADSFESEPWTMF
jgi:hypothetical protein